MFVRTTATISDSSGASSGGKVTGSTGAQAARVGQNCIVDVGAGAVHLTTCQKDIVADFDELDTVDLDLFTIGDRRNSSGGSVDTRNSTNLCRQTPCRRDRWKTSRLERRIFR